jgi:hypothetical protein
VNDDTHSRFASAISESDIESILNAKEYKEIQL